MAMIGWSSMEVVSRICVPSQVYLAVFMTPSLLHVRPGLHSTDVGFF